MNIKTNHGKVESGCHGFMSNPLGKYFIREKIRNPLNSIRRGMQQKSLFNQKLEHIRWYERKSQPKQALDLELSEDHLSLLKE